MTDTRYKRGKIYTIRSHKTDLIYVGSTIERSLSNRLSDHRSKFKGYKEGKYGYCSSFDIFEVDSSCYIELYERFPCDSKLELRKREGEVIRKLDCCNKRVEWRPKEEKKAIRDCYNKQYYINNIDKEKERHKLYRENNKEKVAATRKKSYEKNREKVKERCKQYYINNIDKEKERHKLYRENNKERIKQRNNQPYQCECGSTIRYNGKSTHFKTKKHQRYLSTKTD